MRLKVGTVRKFVKTIVVHEHKSLFSFLYPAFFETRNLQFRLKKGETFLIRDNFATATIKLFVKLDTCKIVRILQRIIVIIIIIVSVKIMTLRRPVSSPKLLCLVYNISTLA